MQCHLRAQGSCTFNWGFLPCPTCTVISLDTLNLFTILCMVLGERPKFCAILHCEMWFWFVWHFSHEICQWWAMIQLCLQRLRSQFQNSLTWIFYNLFTFILPLSQLVWNVLQQSKTTFVHIYKIHLHWSVKTLEIFSLYYCQLNKS